MKFSAAALVLVLAAAAPLCTAQNYPSRPIRLVITYPPGGTTDFVGRPIAQKLSEFYGQPTVVDNRGGAGGVIATMIVAQALPDGYTLLLGTSSGMLINPLLNPALPYDAFRDFSPVSRTNINPQALVANAA
ncbi:MAG: Bug family tripartite tricarboxylate transporter substrate binding protein, partial [Burkholderiales bacterium]